MGLGDASDALAARQLASSVVRMNRQELDADDGMSRLVGMRHGFKSQRFAAWSQSCCRTLVLPLYGSSGGGGVFPAFSAYTAEAQHVRDLVANGNVLVLVGGTMGKEFLNRYFGFKIQEADGGYSRGPWDRRLLDQGREKHLGVFANCAQQLQQGGSADAAVPMKTASLPPVSSVIYGDKLSATVVHIPYCERLSSSGPPASEEPSRCHGHERNEGACSCGHIIFISKAFRHSAGSPSPWDTVLRAAVEFESASVSPTRPRPAATGIMPAAGVPPSAGEEGRAVVPRSADAGGENGEKENLQRLAVDFVKHPHQRGPESLASELTSLQHVVAELGAATGAQRAERGPLKHPLQPIDSTAKLHALQRLETAREKLRAQSLGVLSSPVISRKRDQSLINTLETVLKQAGPPPKKHRRGFFD